MVVSGLQFDVFGFSRGAAAARHFVNRVYERDPALVKIITSGLGSLSYKGKPAGDVRFLGIFDTVTAVGGLLDGFDPHDSNNLRVKLALPGGCAQHVFHLTAMNECRYNFCLNSVQGHWPELSLPGVHSDIGGGYNPQEAEYLFLTRPEIQTVPIDMPERETQAYRHAIRQVEQLPHYATLAPLLSSGRIEIVSNTDSRQPMDLYGYPKKRVGAAVTFRRTVTNDWSKVTLRVMYEVAKMAGVRFDGIDSDDPSFKIASELSAICDRAIAQGKAVAANTKFISFTPEELHIIGKYIHCSANWNAVNRYAKNAVLQGASPSKTISFVNRPDEDWKRTVYSMDEEISK